VLQTTIDNLFCLGDRVRHPNGAEWLGRVGLDEILKRAETFFERIVIDSAPLMAVSDTLSIAKNVSIICLVVHAGHTPRRLVRRAVKMLDEVAKRTATGVILNKASRQNSAEHYYYYSSPAKHSPAPK
jgi:polysaccharide biosynthesis transport protein